ncbi:MAG TPA: beta-ketoacyl synthase N-terminal-like domain-containing protein [Longimicrobium sp.]|nr:beta-ketoacyl synthase N-terminal-like domain-containing protein [Longimicrobium sp.]
MDPVSEMESMENVERSDADTEAGFGTEIAVVGMAGRFPGADTLAELWAMIAEGREGITTFSDDELRAAGTPDAWLSDASFVKRLGVLREVDRFDAAFFGYSPREVEVLEPAHRLFLECAWEALENAGVDPARAGGAVGVYAGAGEPTYARGNVLTRPELVEALGLFAIVIGSNKDFLPTRTAYKLDLRGPAVGVQTGCSTSLVAVHLAVQALLSRECDVALAGGASVNVPHRTGYHWEPAGIMSADGSCRAFDAGATGTAGGSGAGVVVLKRLDDARRDGDTVRAVIRGSAVNNDGALKVAFTAPSVEGQAAVIGEALAVAGVDPATIRYVEGHGSGTEMGDPIEIAALSEAFAGVEGTRRTAVGSIKSNIGHADAAAGVAGFIKTVLALESRVVPPTAHFRAPNPRIPFHRSPFYVSGEAEAWERDGAPRRAGVSSFGIGGTNAHVVLEEAPEPRPSAARRPWHLLTLSARTPTALDAAAARLAGHLRAHPGLPLADVAHTLQAGRREMAHRRVLAVRDGEDAAALLEGAQPDRVSSGATGEALRSVAFIFPGVGDQYPQMARGLYEGEPVFRAEVDRCAGLLRARFGLDLLAALYPGDAPEEAVPGAGIDLRRMLAQGAADPAAEALNRTELAQPAVFVIEYALAKLWMSWGIVPAAVIGHSLGEYAAAVVAGVFTLEDALALVTARGRMIEALPAGAMLAVPLSADAARGFLVDGAAVATLNAPELCVVAGTPEAVEAVRAKLADAGHAARPLAATHAFHSPQMDALVGPVGEMVGRMRLAAPSIPFVSNVTGTWITAAQATDPAYWARHIREPVQFERGVAALLQDAGRVLLEMGPGQTLSTFVRQRPDSAGVPVIPTVRYPYDRTGDTAFALGALGRLWLAGVTPDWAAFHHGESLRRVPLPTYPWERQRFWIDPPAPGEPSPSIQTGKRANPAEWLYLPTWKRTPAARLAADDGARWLVFHDGGVQGHDVAAALRSHGRAVTLVSRGEHFAHVGDEATVRPASREDLAALVAAAGGESPLHAVHVASAGEAFVSVAQLAAELGRRGAEARLVVVTCGARVVTGGEAVDAAAATVLGAAAVAPEEHPGLACIAVDVVPGDREAARAVAAEALSDKKDSAVAVRRGRRWVRGFDRVEPAGDGGVEPGAVWLFAGGVEGRSELLARHVATRGARLVLADERMSDRLAWDHLMAVSPADDPVRRMVETARELEAAGAEVLTLRVPLFNARQVDDAFAAAARRFGRVDVVVASPALDPLGGFEALDEVSNAEWSSRFALLRQELEFVAAAARAHGVGRVLVESSLTPVLGGVGRARIAAAQSYVDAFAHARHAEGARWTALGWDRWYDAGEADGYGMAPGEAAAAFDHALSLADEPHLLLSTGDLAARMAGRGRPAAAGAAAMHARPELETEYHAPSTGSEHAIAEMWQELLGIERIGVHDDFFGLGGHSLLATQIVSRVRDRFGLELPLKSVFEAPTIARYAGLVEAAIMAEIDAMSEDEILSSV